MSDPTATQADLLLHAGWVIPVEPAGAVLEGYSVAVRDGAVAAVLPRAEAAGWRAQEVIELPRHALLPGFINAHGHAAMALLRGYADDRPLMPWLEQHIWPAEAQHASAAFVRDGTRLAMAEMLRAGTTTFSDMYFFPEVVAELLRDTGMRGQLTVPILEFPTNWGRGPDDYISRAVALHDEWRQLDRVQIVFGPHAPYTVAEATLARVATLAAELDLPAQMHLHETEAELQQALRESGERPLAMLDRIGLLGPRMQCVHMTQVDDEDIERLRRTGASVVHCPESNMKLASGTCPVARLLDEGINVALGTDSAASNNDLNMLGELRIAALLGKLAAGDATRVSAAEALHMATLGGARALGLGESIGSIAEGKRADLIAIDLDVPETQPVYDPLSQVVYAAAASQISHVWIDGRCLLRRRQIESPLLADTPSLAMAWRDRIAATGASA